MKEIRISLFTILFLAIIMMMACSEDEKAAPELDVSIRQIEMTAEGGNADVNVTSNIGWTVSSSSSDWCKVFPTSGNGNGTFKVTVDPNMLLENREATISVKGEAIEKTINVVQDAASFEDILIGRWEMTAQNSGDSNYDDLIGMIVEINENKSAKVILNIEIPGVGMVDEIAGTWKLENDQLDISGEIMDIPAVLFLKIDQSTEKLINCHMGINLPGLFPPEGIPVVFAKKQVQN